MDEYGRDERLRDFRNFVFLVWQHLNLPSPTKAQYDIASYLQHGPRSCIIQAFRGIGKSFLTAAYVLWSLYWSPQLKFLIVSASKDRADAFSIFTKRLIMEIPQLHFLRPRDDQRNSTVSFDVGPAMADQSPSVKSVGIGGQITGSRADVIIADDVEVAKNSQTALMRDRLMQLVEEFAAILKPLPDSRIIYLGTPQTEFSVYNTLANQRGYPLRVWPARVPGPEKMASYHGRLAPYIDAMIEAGAKPGTPVDPERFGEEELLEKESKYARSGFALQFQLDTTLSDQERYPLRLADFMVLPLNKDVAPVQLVWGSGPDQQISHLPVVGLSGDRWHRPMHVSKDFSPYTGSVLYVDPSGRGKDETGYAVVKILNGVLFLTAVGGIRGGYTPEALTVLASTAKDHKVNLIVVESNFGDGMFTQLLKPVVNRVYPCTIEEDHSTGQKERRIIDILEPVLNQHRLVIDEDIIRQDFKTEQTDYQFLTQLTRITTEKHALRHDDRLEAVAGAVKYWVESMARDTNQAVNETREAALMDALKSHIESCLGGSSAQDDRWFKIGH